MKKMFKALVMMACVLGLGLATSCSKDDDDDDLLIGTWQLVSEVIDDGTVQEYDGSTNSTITFSKNGNCAMTEGNYSETVKYSHNGNSLVFTFKEEDGSNYNAYCIITKLTKSELSIYSEGDDDDDEVYGFTANYKRI